MKKTMTLLLVLALLATLLAGCGSGGGKVSDLLPGISGEQPTASHSPTPLLPIPSDSPEPTVPTEQPATPSTLPTAQTTEPEPTDPPLPDKPTLLDFSVDSKFDSEQRGDGYVYLTYPFYTLGRKDEDGNLVQPYGFKALEKALVLANDEVRREAVDAWQRMENPAQYDSLYWNTRGTVTRADSTVVSFYETTQRRESSNQTNVFTEYRTHNLDAATGKELTFQDVFTDMDYLPSLILMEIGGAYPDDTFYDDALDFLRMSIRGNDGNLCFALSYGCVHIFANEGMLNDKPGGQHITISYVMNYQIREEYKTAPDRWLLPLDYDVDYWPNEISTGFRLRSVDASDEGVELFWIVESKGTDAPMYDELYDFYAPSCWLVHDGVPNLGRERNFIYLQVPSGDVSMLTYVYEVTEKGVKKLNDKMLGLAISSNSPANPVAMEMQINEIVYSSAGMMLPIGTYAVGSDGLPKLASNVFWLTGMDMTLRRNGSYKTADGDTVSLSAGQLVTPYRTDHVSWIDFRTDGGVILRFSINEFSDEMQLDDRGGLDDVFAPVGVG